MADSESPAPKRTALQRSRSNFLTRTAADTAAQLDRRLSMNPPVEEQQPQTTSQQSDPIENPYEPLTNASKPVPHRHDLTKKILGLHDGSNDDPTPIRRSSSGRRRSSQGLLGDTSLTAHTHKHGKAQSKDEDAPVPRIGSLPRPVGGHGKLGTFSGVFVPTSLNVLSILMFLRFGLILGQSGALGMMGEVIDPCFYIIFCCTCLPGLWS